MGSKPKKIIGIAWVLALVLMFFWSAEQSLRVFWATSGHQQIPKNTAELVEPARTEFKRSEQKYFLAYGIYVPLEDIMFVGQLSEGGKRYTDALGRSCAGTSAGSGVAIWLPLKFVWPLVGERVIEWCWKLPTQR